MTLLRPTHPSRPMACPSPAPRRTLATRARAAFTLIEVLLATAMVVIALLGVAALFPRVLRSQMDAAQSASSIPQDENARASILGRAETGSAFWRDWADQASNSNQPYLPLDASWLIPDVFATNTTLPGGLTVPAGGIWLGTITTQRQRKFRDTADLVYQRDQRVVIPLEERLRLETPDNTVSIGSVWDIAVRRTGIKYEPLLDAGRLNPRTEDSSRVQVVVFVRPIDPNIRTGSSTTGQPLTIKQSLNLRDASIPAADRRLPVSEDANGQGPTLDGTFNNRRYSNLAALEVQAVRGNPQLLRVIGWDTAHGYPNNRFPIATAQRLARQGGQTLVDNLGNILKVAPPADDDLPEFIRLATPLNESIVGGTTSPIFQVIFSPQKPLRVSTFIANP